MNQLEGAALVLLQKRAVEQQIRPLIYNKQLLKQILLQNQVVPKQHNAGQLERERGHYFLVRLPAEAQLEQDEDDDLQRRVPGLKLLAKIL